MPEDIATQPLIEDCIMVGVPHRWLSLDGQDDRDDDSEDFSNRASASDYVEEDRARRSNAAAPSSSEDDDDPDASFDTLKNTTILKARFQLSPVRVKTVTGHRSTFSPSPTPSGPRFGIMAPRPTRKPAKRRTSTSPKDERPRKRISVTTAPRTNEYAFMGNKSSRSSISSPATSRSTPKQPAAQQKRVAETKNLERLADSSEIQMLRDSLEKMTRKHGQEQQKASILQATQLLTSDHLEATSARVERLVNELHRLRQTTKHLTEKNEKLEADLLAKEVAKQPSASHLATPSRASSTKLSIASAPLHQVGNLGHFVTPESEVLRVPKDTEIAKLQGKYKVALADLDTEQRKRKESSETLNQVKADMSKLLQQIDQLTSEKEQLTTQTQKVRDSGAKDRAALLAKIDLLETKVASLSRIEVAKRSLELTKIAMWTKITRLENAQAKWKEVGKRNEDWVISLKAEKISLEKRLVDAQAAQREAQQEREAVARDLEQSNKELDDRIRTDAEVAAEIRAFTSSYGELPPVRTPENPRGSFN